MKVTVNPVCPDFQPLSMDTVTVKGVSDEPFSVKLVQHSPERKDLVLYDSAFPAAAADLYIFGAEPGDYTIYIGMDAVKDSAVRRIFQQDFTIENADYIKGDDAVLYTDYRFSLALTGAAGDNPAVPAVTKQPQKITDGCCLKEQTVMFRWYAVLRGDYDADGKVTANDAQYTLNAYAAALAGDETEAPADYEQQAACDIDGDGILSAADAQRILMYYTVSLTGTAPQWESEPSEA